MGVSIIHGVAAFAAGNRFRGRVAAEHAARPERGFISFIDPKPHSSQQTMRRVSAVGGASPCTSILPSLTDFVAVQGYFSAVQETARRHDGCGLNRSVAAKLKDGLA
jgi:predicted Abi (CAAX) family protease